MRTVLLLGGNGMLGSMVERVLLEHGIKVYSTMKSPNKGHSIQFDAAKDNPNDLFTHLPRIDYVVNAIGIIKPRIQESDSASRQTAVQINASFPYVLAQVAHTHGSHVIQIATDCVYSGKSGLNSESTLHDPTDVYGKSKSLGEVPSSNVLNLRVSIIGPEIDRQTSLLEWVRNQPANAEISGYLNHLWNGVTTQHFGHICAGVIMSGSTESGTFHVTPADIVNKFELVTLIANAAGRTDISIRPVNGPDSIDRTLSTEYPAINSRLWNDAGYETPPSIEQMIRELNL
jgi:dTDP-4-dehydrorhamnose reductase